MCKAHCEWHTANKTNSHSEQQWISQKPLSFEQESLNELRYCASHITFVCEWIIVLVQKVKKRSFKKTYSELTIKFPLKSCNKFFLLIFTFQIDQYYSLLFWSHFISCVKPKTWNSRVSLMYAVCWYLHNSSFQEGTYFHKLHSFLTRYENLDWIYFPLKILSLRHTTLQIDQQTFIFINSPIEVSTATKGCWV